jgi:hypothetical protein
MLYYVVREVVQTYGFESQYLTATGSWDRRLSRAAAVARTEAETRATALNARVVSY